MLGICKCAEGAVSESEWPVEQGPSKGKNFEGKTLLKQQPLLCKKPLKTRVKHPKCCNHYLDKDRTHIVPVNKSVPKTEPVDKILKGLIKVG